MEELFQREKATKKPMKLSSQFILRKKFQKLKEIIERN